jgi:hypothetical protein
MDMEDEADEEAAAAEDEADNVAFALADIEP